MTLRAVCLITSLLLFPVGAHAMCGGSKTSDGKAQTQNHNMCGGGSMKMDMGAKAAEAPKDGTAKSDDPHTGMDTGSMDMGSMDMGGMDMSGDKSAADKSGGGMMGCCCCGGGDKKGGGMCGGKQATATSVDGKNDPLVTDPMWNKDKKLPQSTAPTTP